MALLQDTATLHIFAAAQAGLTPTGGNDLSGRITGSGGRPVAGALIQACSGKLCVPARTDAEGFFTLADLPAGSYEIDISPPRGSLARAGVKYFDHADKIVVAKSVWK
ncbi:MAG: carboxypeptidase-like regulatory domain-containing protein [Spirochaetia bacterium]